MFFYRGVNRRKWISVKKKTAPLQSGISRNRFVYLNLQIYLSTSSIMSFFFNTFLQGVDYHLTDSLLYLLDYFEEISNGLEFCEEVHGFCFCSPVGICEVQKLIFYTMNNCLTSCLNVLRLQCVPFTGLKTSLSMVNTCFQQ